VVLSALFEPGTAIENIEVGGNFILYPNPTNGQLQITNYELGISNIEIFDVLGRKQQFSIINSQFSIHHLPAGIYLIRLTNGEHSSVKRFVKE
jgi:hypothetical protein